MRLRIPPQRGEGKLAGVSEANPRGRNGTNDTHPGRVAGTPRAPAAAGAHSFYCNIPGSVCAHRRLRSQRPSASGMMESGESKEPKNSVRELRLFLGFLRFL